MEAHQRSMAQVNKSFTAPKKECDVEMTVKRSRFIGSVRTVLSADEAAELIKSFPTLYPKANHHCWAYRVGIDSPLEHCSDAGEPAGTAGRPILGTLKRHMLENTLNGVTRYFGGIKLGVRGLIEAYGESAELAVAEAGTVEVQSGYFRFLAGGLCGPRPPSRKRVVGVRPDVYGQRHPARNLWRDVRVKRPLRSRQ